MFAKFFLKFNHLIQKCFKPLEKMLFLKPCYYQLEKIGSQYGGWVVPTGLIKPTAICYCAGVGEDITFDLGIIERFSCQVFAFDPTPRAKKYVEKTVSKNPKFNFYDIGLWSQDSRQKFFVPSNPRYVSHSIVNLKGTKKFFEARCKRLSTIMQGLNHEKIDLLKIDIEGAEHEVLQSIVEDELDIKVICVEFEPMSYFKIFGTILKLISQQYSLVNIDGSNYTFIKNKYFQLT